LIQKVTAAAAAKKSRIYKLAALKQYKFIADASNFTKV